MQEAQGAVQHIQDRHPQLVLTAAADPAAAAAVSAEAVPQPAQIVGVVSGCISLLVAVHKLTDPTDAAAAAAGAVGTTVAQQLGGAGVEAALDMVLMQLKPRSGKNMQAYSDIVATVGQLKAQLARAC
jgi:hypothetical protein